jgi:hypothetical protein
MPLLRAAVESAFEREERGMKIPGDLQFWHNSLLDDKERYFNAPVAEVRKLIERIAAVTAERDKLRDQIAEADEWLPGECAGYQTLGERTKLLKDQLEYALEDSAAVRKALTAVNTERDKLRAEVAKLKCLHLHPFRKQKEDGRWEYWCKDCGILLQVTILPPRSDAAHEAREKESAE